MLWLTWSRSGYPDEATAEAAADEAQQRVAGDDSPPEQTVGLEQA
jgi:hypothetical protein